MDRAFLLTGLTSGALKRERKLKPMVTSIASFKQVVSTRSDLQVSRLQGGPGLVRSGKLVEEAQENQGSSCGCLI
jgi:hypothetical protein